MKRLFLSLALSLSLTLTPALAAGDLTVDGRAVDAAATVRNNTTYVSLRAVTQALQPDALILWTGDRALAEGEDFTLTAQPGALYLEVNDRALYIPQGVLLESGRTLVPVRVLAEARQAAETLLERDPELSRPENRPVLERVRRLFADTPDIFN